MRDYFAYAAFPVLEKKYDANPVFIGERLKNMSHVPFLVRHDIPVLPRF
jgi:hypothetical protein